ncbi:MAG: hypothetical protein AAGA11_05050 [Pseudomonadota bacterium]
MIARAMLVLVCAALPSIGAASAIRYDYLDYRRVQLDDRLSQPRYAHELVLHGQLDGDLIYRLGLRSGPATERYSLAGGLTHDYTLSRSSYALLGVQLDGDDLQANFDGGLRAKVFGGAVEFNGAVSAQASHAADDGVEVSAGLHVFVAPGVALGVSLARATGDVRTARLSLRFEQHSDAARRQRLP